MIAWIVIAAPWARPDGLRLLRFKRGCGDRTVIQVKRWKRFWARFGPFNLPLRVSESGEGR
jgi:hypothetical protein